jgi:hypothetical protein
MEHFYDKIYGWMELHKAEPLWNTILEKMPSNKINVAEIGVFMGRGTALINVLLINKNFEYNYYAIDHFKGSEDFFVNIPSLHFEGKDYYPIAYENLKTFLDANQNVKLIKNDSITESANYSDGYFDIVYIDASHDYDSVKKDILSWLPKVKQGGIMCGDDYTHAWPGVLKAVQEVFGDGVQFSPPDQWWVQI